MCVIFIVEYGVMTSNGIISLHALGYNLDSGIEYLFGILLIVTSDVLNLLTKDVQLENLSMINLGSHQISGVANSVPLRGYC